MIAGLIFMAAGSFAGAAPVGAARLVTAADYPDSAFNRGLEGAQRYAVTVDAAGKPVACAVVMSTGAEALRDVPCRVAMRRGRFTPARDADGAPIAGVWTADAALYSPDRTAPAPRIFYDVAIRVARLPPADAPVLAEIEQLVDAEGQVKDCQIARGSGADALDRLACRTVGPPFTPIRDAAGKATGAVVKQTVLFVTENMVAR